MSSYLVNCDNIRPFDQA